MQYHELIRVVSRNPRYTLLPSTSTFLEPKQDTLHQQIICSNYPTSAVCEILDHTREGASIAKLLWHIKEQLHETEIWFG